MKPLPESDLGVLLKEMRPELSPGRFVFVQLSDEEALEIEALATVREPEGLSAVVSESDAIDAGLDFDFVAGWITLKVNSALEAVGLTAAVSQCLAGAGISCNVIAGINHDHLLVPVDRAEEAIGLLRALAEG